MTAGQAHAAPPATDPFVVVLGIAQDAGYPQAGCQKPCCARAWDDPALRRQPACVAVVDPASGQRWLFECTPGFVEQLHALDAVAPRRAEGPLLDGVLLTHAHIGHYAGLIHLGREVIGARGVRVHAMPRMRRFLTDNGPWSQLVELGNVELADLQADEPVALSERIRVTPLLVPHRDEFSETVGYRIEGPDAAVLFVPDIDKWDRWQTPLEKVLATVDCAYLDATFFDGAELPGRNMSQIPHPSIVETIERLAPLPASERTKVRLLHFNHTNPVLDPESNQARLVREAGLRLAVEGERVGL